MQVHDPTALDGLLEASHGRELAGVAGAVPARRRGVPSARPLAPRARAAARDDPSREHAAAAAAARRSRQRDGAPAARPRTAPARSTSGPIEHAGRTAEPGATALGHTRDLGLKRSVFWPTKVIAVDRVEPIGYRSTVGREDSRVGFWEAGRTGPPGGYSRGPTPAGRQRKSANEIYGYPSRPTAAEERTRRKAERERSRSQARMLAARSADSVFGAEEPEPEPEPEPQPETPSKHGGGAMIYVNTKEAGMQIHYSANPSAPVHVKVSQFSPGKSPRPPAQGQEQQDQQDQPGSAHAGRRDRGGGGVGGGVAEQQQQQQQPEAIPEDGESQEESAWDEPPPHAADDP
jgi:hypothetical protein